MFLSLEWLGDFVDLDLSDPALPERLAEEMFMGGIEAELIERPGEGLESLLIAEVISAEKHPRADRLTLCRVHDGAAERRIVCGAPNVAVGQRVVLAPPGAVLPDGTKIEAARIRGEESQGMICSERELGLGDDHSGILVLGGEAERGAPAAPLLGLADAIFEISVTPNRGDCLSVLGVAREISAILGAALKPPEIAVEEDPGDPAEALCGVEILDPEKCPRYVARVIRGARGGASPQWMQRRLRAAGMRPIGNIVDVTNYVMLTLGQPLHAFDLDTLEEGKIVVRRWRPEDGPFATLDGQERKMTEEDLMICDAARPVAIGGVMGGLNTEIGDSTENILLESAYFSPSTIRSTRRRLNISTESSYRFERGVDPAGTRRAADWAIELIRQAAGGRTAPGAVDIRPRPHEPLRVRLRAKRTADVLGLEVEPALIRRELEALGMKVRKSRKKDVIEVEVPAFRHDIEREIDLIEEVARRIGYGAIPSSLPRTEAPPERLSDLARLEQGAREAMISSGFDEALNYSFQSRADLDRLGAAGADLVPLQNPLSAEMDVMRTTLLAGLLRNAALNLNRGLVGVRMFEVGRTFHARAGEKLPREITRIAAISSESAAPSLWPEAPSPGGEIALPGRLFDLKGVLERMGRILHFPEFGFSGPGGEDAGPAFERGAAASVYVNGTLAGVFGQIEGAVLDNFGIREKIYAFEVDLGVLAGTPRPPLRFRALPRFPASLRDLAIVVKEEIAQEAAGEAIREAGGELLETATLFDIYRDPALAAEGKKSLAYSLVFRHTDRTLNDEEVDEVFWRILGRLEERLGARLRSQEFS